MGLRGFLSCGYKGSKMKLRTLGLTKECAKHVEMHLSGYKLTPVKKIAREFTELCAVTLG